MQEGKKIYVESILSDEEYRAYAKVYHNTYNSDIKPPFFDSEFKWRWRMGSNLTEDEIIVINERIEFLIKSKVLLCTA